MTKFKFVCNKCSEDEPCVLTIESEEHIETPDCCMYKHVDVTPNWKDKTKKEEVDND